MPFFINEETFYEDISMTQKEFYQYIFNNLNIKGDIDDTLNAVLKYAYINQETKELLSTLNLSALADCFCKHDGSLKDGVEVVSPILICFNVGVPVHFCPII